MKRLLLLITVITALATACAPKAEHATVTAAKAPTRQEIVPGDTMPAKDGVEYYKTCHLDDLSTVYDYLVDFSRFHKGDDDSAASCHIRIIVTPKKGGAAVDTLRVSAYYLYSFVFESCLKARSYITGRNADSIALDSDYGEIVIGDYNFDGKEDIAVIHDSGGNNGPIYCFFLQDSSRHFRLNTFLTDSMASFPDRINKRKKTLVTIGHASACSVAVRTFRYDSQTNSYSKISHKIEGICK